jgi:hypothetical protein
MYQLIVNAFVELKEKQKVAEWIKKWEEDSLNWEKSSFISDVHVEGS